MAPHPFTTIDPNIGYCLVPAPAGSCPEDDSDGEGTLTGRIGCTHGRDSHGRRLLPVLFKDVAGLVPGAYQGRGKGNKFLDDLTDGDALIHVVDASGTADVEGNTVGIDEDDNTGAGSHPLNDLAWVHNELIQWVFMNLEYISDAVLGVAFLIVAIVAAQRMAWSNKHDGTDTSVVTAFYSLILCTSIIRSIWFLIPSSVMEPSYVPQALMAFTSKDWLGGFISEILLSVGSLGLFSIFILILVYWADILKKYFQPGVQRSKPMKTFKKIVFFLFF